jgi:hypothetical protein
MRKLAYIQKLGNGVLLTVTDESGNDVPFFLPDDGAAISRTVSQVADKAGEGKKPVHVQKLGNGLLLSVDGGDDFFVQAETSDAFKDLERAFDTASTSAKKEAYQEPADEPEPQRRQHRGPHEDDYEYSDDPGISDVGAYYFRKAARFVNENPQVGSFLGEVLSGLSSMEEKRDRMKKGRK